MIAYALPVAVLACVGLALVADGLMPRWPAPRAALVWRISGASLIGVALANAWSLRTDGSPRDWNTDDVWALAPAAYSAAGDYETLRTTLRSPAYRSIIRTLAAFDPVDAASGSGRALLVDRVPAAAAPSSDEGWTVLPASPGYVIVVREFDSWLNLQGARVCDPAGGACRDLLLKAGGSTFVARVAGPAPLVADHQVQIPLHPVGSVEKRAFLFGMPGESCRWTVEDVRGPRVLQAPGDGPLIVQGPWETEGTLTLQREPLDAGCNGDPPWVPGVLEIDAADADRWSSWRVDL